MASTTNNGWPKDPKVVRIYVGKDANGAEFARGDVASLFAHFFGRFHREVEPVRILNGYRSSAFNASIPGSIPSSNHVSGTAGDVNGDVHKNEAVSGITGSGFSSAQTQRIRQIQADMRNLIKWGGDFPKGKRDWMHFEVQGSAAQIRDYLATLATPPTPTPTPPSGGSYIGEDNMYDQIEQYYARFLGRGCTTTDLINWTNTLSGKSPAEGQAIFQNSAPESGSVVAAYREFLNREPGADEINFWVKNAPTIAALRSGVANSEEAKG